MSFLNSSSKGNTFGNDVSSSPQQKHHHSIHSIQNNPLMKNAATKRELSPSSYKKNLDVFHINAQASSSSLPFNGGDDHPLFDITRSKHSNLSSINNIHQFNSSSLTQGLPKQPLTLGIESITPNTESLIQSSRTSCYAHRKPIIAWKPLSQEEKEALTKNVSNKDSVEEENSQQTLNENLSTTNSGVVDISNFMASRKRLKMNHLTRPTNDFQFKPITTNSIFSNNNVSLQNEVSNSRFSVSHSTNNLSINLNKVASTTTLPERVSLLLQNTRKPVLETIETGSTNTSFTKESSKPTVDSIAAKWQQYYGNYPKNQSSNSTSTDPSSLQTRHNTSSISTTSKTGNSLLVTKSLFQNNGNNSNLLNNSFRSNTENNSNISSLTSSSMLNQSSIVPSIPFSQPVKISTILPSPAKMNIPTRESMYNIQPLASQHIPADVLNISTNLNSSILDNTGQLESDEAFEVSGIENSTLNSSNILANIQSTKSSKVSKLNTTSSGKFSEKLVASGKQFQQIRKNKEELILFQTVFYQIHYIVAKVIDSFEKQKEKMEQQLYSAWCLIQERKKTLHDRKECLYKKQSSAKLHELLNFSFNQNSIDELLPSLDHYFEVYGIMNSELRQSLNCIALSDDIDVSTPEHSRSGLENGNEIAACLDKSDQILQSLCTEMYDLMEHISNMKTQFSRLGSIVNQTASEISELSNNQIPHLSNIESEHTSLMYQKVQGNVKPRSDNPFSFDTLRESLGL
ncbi:hypothetical protein FDP41_002827 [Naegleria fowleri]|uniref:Uncharacterized protein n=1 Tax=Naegleria fowleri TaxID=5763 RepID=A0A6A5BUC2_NAEFO|nr:uncharacterized protein FDP41_002827 [Naegleria fowleri]KAF0978312.1 hypothetical protein FDP41_002827 [Naegleria fowleri]